MILDIEVVPLIATGIYDYLLPGLFLLAFLTFTWGTFQYFVHGSADEEIKEKAKALMFYGLLCFFAMLVIWFVFTIALPIRGGA